MNKFCQKCRTWQTRDNYYRKVTEVAIKRDRLCIQCRDLKNYILALPKMANVNQPDLRARELALIPNPFDRKIDRVTDNHNFLWSDCV